MLAIVHSASIIGLKAELVRVEIDVSVRTLPNFTIVGLPDKAVQESRERVMAAIHNSGAAPPPRKIVINLAPADIPKQGSLFDLPIAVGVLQATEEINVDLSEALFVGEVSLDGDVRKSRGVLALCLMAKKLNIPKVFFPAENTSEAQLVSGLQLYPVSTLAQIVRHLTGAEPIEPVPSRDISQALATQSVEVDMSHIYGQEQAKRAAQISAAGGHNLYLHGVPGAGKTMLSKAISGILPKLTIQEALDITNIYSVAGKLSLETGLITNRPFRHPHHTTSKVGLIGGGSMPKPGEISLAHRGVLFLDEFPEFSRDVLESLRQPLEDGVVQITRASMSLEYPCRFMLIAAANPCPCGHKGSRIRACTCTPLEILRYQKRISGPLLERIDLHVHVQAVEVIKLAKAEPDTITSQQIRATVQQARDIQLDRFANSELTCNADMSNQTIKQFCPLSVKAQDFLTSATARLGLSARSYFKTIKVARTIADLSQVSDISEQHLAEAIQYRPVQE